MKNACLLVWSEIAAVKSSLGGNEGMNLRMSLRRGSEVVSKISHDEDQDHERKGNQGPLWG
jgi:hypothetical protein